MSLRVTRQADIPYGARDVDTFAEEIFGYLSRADQRRWARTYLKGLLLTEGKKSMRRLAEAASASPTAWYSLQQFINNSPWEWEPARHALARWVEQRSSVRAWTIAPIILPKRGGHAVGVHRRFVASAGRAFNCQVGMALFLSCPGASFPVDWRLVLPPEWLDDTALRQRARIPGAATCQPQWKHMLDLLSRMTDRTSRGPVPVVADMSDIPTVSKLIATMEHARHDFVIAMHPRALHKKPDRVHADRTRRRREVPARATDSVVDAPLAWSHHTATVMRADGTLRHANVQSALLWQPSPAAADMGETRQVYRLFTELSSEGHPASPVWITNLVHHRLDELLEFTRFYMSSTITAACLDERFELLDFAGRSFPAWHHHMTMASAAYVYMRIGRAGHPHESMPGSA